MVNIVYSVCSICKVPYHIKYVPGVPQVGDFHKNFTDILHFVCNLSTLTNYDFWNQFWNFLPKLWHLTMSSVFRNVKNTQYIEVYMFGAKCTCVCIFLKMILLNKSKFRVKQMVYVWMQMQGQVHVWTSKKGIC